jgi:hypothetical protein
MLFTPQVKEKVEIAKDRRTPVWAGANATFSYASRRVMKEALKRSPIF